MKSYILVTSVLILIFSACSTKEVYTPLQLDNDWSQYKQTKEKIVDISYDVALEENRKVLTESGSVDVIIDKDKRVISNSDGWIISSSIDGNLTLTSVDDNTLEEYFNLKKTVASASVKGDNLAVLFADNELAIYSVSTKEIIFKEQGTESLAVDTKIVNPFFINDLIFFSTLDGKVVIVNIKLKKRLRTVIVSAEDNFNNIIYFNMMDNKVIAATGYKVLSMSDKEIRANYEIRNILNDDKSIYVTTKQGEVISMTSDLQVNRKIKFPFAHFVGMIATEKKLYILEKEGYLIILDKNLLSYKVHRLIDTYNDSDIQNDFLEKNNMNYKKYNIDISNSYIFATDKAFQIDNKQILIK